MRTLVTDGTGFIGAAVVRLPRGRLWLGNLAAYGLIAKHTVRSLSSAHRSNDPRLALGVHRRLQIAHLPPLLRRERQRGQSQCAVSVDWS